MEKMLVLSIPSEGLPQPPCCISANGKKYARKVPSSVWNMPNLSHPSEVSFWLVKGVHIHAWLESSVKRSAMCTRSVETLPGPLRAQSTMPSHAEASAPVMHRVDAGGCCGVPMPTPHGPRGGGEGGRSMHGVSGHG